MLKRKPVSAVFILLLWSILLRLIVYVLLPGAKEMDQYPGTSILYFSALTDHFADYISHITLIPPASYIINASVFCVFGIKNALHIRAFSMLVSVMDIVAGLLLFYSAIKMGARRKYSLILISLFSAVLVPFELWREGMHYDQHTVFFVSFFAWSLVMLIKNTDSYKSMVWASVAGGLLVAQSAVNAAVVPFSLIIILGFIYLPIKQVRTLLVALFITLFLPVTFLILISIKNQKVGEEKLTSNKAGPAMMMVVQRSYNYDTNKIRSAIKESGAPEWYQWTYNHASVSKDPITGNPDNLMFTLSQAFGICFYSDVSIEKTGPFGFDFHPLISHLRQNNSLTSFVRMVEADSADAIHQPFRLSGYSPELSPRWIGIYGDVSKKIFFKTLLKNPQGMLKSFVIQQGIFSIYGPLFPFNTMNKKTNLLVRSGLRTLPAKMPLYPVFAFFVLVYAVIAWLTYATALVNIPFAVITWIKNRKQEIPVDPLRKYFLLLSIPLLLVALVYSCLVGGENDRYFMQVTPYIILLAALLPEWYRKKQNALNKKESDLIY